jgi:ferric enterobactin receptor
MSYKIVIAAEAATFHNLYSRKNIWYKEFDVVEGEIFENNILYTGMTFNLFVTIRF